MEIPTKWIFFGINNDEIDKSKLGEFAKKFSKELIRMISAIMEQLASGKNASKAMDHGKSLMLHSR